MFGVSDAKRADRLLKGVLGKRLTYRAADSGKPGQEALAYAGSAVQKAVSEERTNMG